MVEQSLFSGQHRAEEESSKDMQVESDAHLKLSGRAGSIALQVGASLGASKVEAMPCLDVDRALQMVSICNSTINVLCREVCIDIGIAVVVR
jgi:hypothetical protein